MPARIDTRDLADSLVSRSERRGISSSRSTLSLLCRPKRDGLGGAGESGMVLPTGEVEGAENGLNPAR